MQPKLTVQERLKDLRVVDFDLTLEELAERTGLSRSALGKYESDENAKDISPFAILTLAKFYGVSTDYLLGLTENKNHPNTELNALHLSDDAITVLTTGNFNHRLLSEMICHKDFQRMMLDAEIYDVISCTLSYRYAESHPLLVLQGSFALRKRQFPQALMV